MGGNRLEITPDEKAPEEPVDTPEEPKPEETAQPVPDLEGRIKMLEFNAKVQENLLKKIDDTLGKLIPVIASKQGTTGGSLGTGSGDILGIVRDFLKGEGGSGDISSVNEFFRNVGMKQFELFSTSFSRRFAKELGVSDHVNVSHD